MIKKARKRLYLRIIMLTIVFSLLIWAWVLFSQNYRNITLSQKMVDAIIQNNVALAHKYARELGIVQENLDETQGFVLNLKDENEKLKEQIRLLGELKNLEAQIQVLQAENDQLVMKMNSSQGGKKQPGHPSKNKTDSLEFETIEEGKTLLAELRDLVRNVKGRMWKLREKKQAEIDEFESMVGNQGFLIKNGEVLAPVTIMEGRATVEQSGQVKVNVEFVK